MNFALGKPNLWKAGRMLMFLWSVQLWTPALLKSVHFMVLLNISYIFCLIKNVSEESQKGIYFYEFLWYVRHIFKKNTN